MRALIVVTLVLAGCGSSGKAPDAGASGDGAAADSDAPSTDDGAADDGAASDLPDATYTADVLDIPCAAAATHGAYAATLTQAATVSCSSTMQMLSLAIDFEGDWCASLTAAAIPGCTVAACAALNCPEGGTTGFVQADLACGGCTQTYWLTVAPGGGSPDGGGGNPDGSGTTDGGGSPDGSGGTTDAAGSGPDGSGTTGGG